MGTVSIPAPVSQAKTATGGTSRDVGQGLGHLQFPNPTSNNCGLVTTKIDSVFADLG